MQMTPATNRLLNLVSDRHREYRQLVDMTMTVCASEHIMHRLA